MKIESFALERYFAAHEFTARYLLSSSDCEALTMSELLGMADTESRALWDELKLGYTEAPGHPLLREEISSLYEGIDPEEVQVAVPQEGIFLLMHGLLQPGDHVVCTFPAYQSLHEVARSIGCAVTMWEPEEQQGWTFDPARLEQLLRPETRLVVVNFPHNPTGALPTREVFTALVEIVRRRGIYLFSDEMYRFLEESPARTLPSACELYERAITLFGLSKTFGLPGLRIGWLTSRDREVLARVTELRDYTTICASAPSEVLAIIALRQRARIIRAQVARIQRNLQVLDAFFHEHRNIFSWQRPRGGSVGLARMLREPDTLVFCQRLLAKTGIMLAPSAMFQYGKQHVRIGFGREDLPVVMDRLASYLSRQRDS